MARLVRLAQSLGFTLREIGALNDELRAAGMTRARKAAILRERLGGFEAKAAEIARMTTYLRAKIAWIEDGESGPEPKLAVPGGNGELLPCPTADPGAGSPSRRGRRRAVVMARV
jgi:MerR family copper efflux transcriptional regulator